MSVVRGEAPCGRGLRAWGRGLRQGQFKSQGVSSGRGRAWAQCVSYDWTWSGAELRNRFGEPPGRAVGGLRSWPDGVIDRRS